MSDFQLFSLVKRKAIYNPKGILNCIEVPEEGWKQTRLAQDSGKGSFDPQTIFHWTGKNLAISDSENQAHADQNLTGFEKEQAGGIEGTFEDFGKQKETSVIYNNGYSYLYKHVPKADTQLVDGRSYYFILKQVLSNSYTFPLKSDCLSELSMLDLIKDKKLEENYFGTKSGSSVVPVLFNLNDDVINPPSLVASELFVGIGDKTTESNSHIVVFDSKEVTYRGIFPPIIELQFAKYLGLLSWQKLESKSETEYKESGKRMVKRTGQIIPERLPSNTSIDYLPDDRGQKLVISPAKLVYKMVFKLYEG
nr:hypothetical protein [Bacteroidota bacterium]